MPYEVYDINETTGVLNGFKSGINLDEYNDGICDTVQIPASVTSIANTAFYVNKIPSFVKNLTFENGSNCSSIGHNAFMNCSSLISVIFSNTLQKINPCAFSFCTNLSSITWNAWQDGTDIGEGTGFNQISSSGTVLVINPVDSQHDSNQLFHYLQTNAELPSSWTAAS